MKSEDEIFERKIRFPSSQPEEQLHYVADNGQDTNQETGERQTREATLNHVLTNIVILQEFILELAALIQVRASLLDGELRFV